MNDEITPELFGHLAELAALELRPDETEYLRREMNNQLQALREMEAVSLDPNTPLALRGVAYTSASAPALREDVIQPFPDSARLLRTAPEVADRYIIVPEIPHQNLQ